MIGCKGVLVFLFPALYASIGQAYGAEEVVGVEASAMGGVAVAASGDNSGITVNPGVIGLEQRYDLGAYFRYGDGGGRHWAVNAVDARTVQGLALGLAYSGDRYEGELFPGELPGWRVPGEEVANQKRTDDFALALALPMASRRVSLGVNGGLSLFDHDRLGRGAQFNMDAGLGVRPVAWLTVGVVARNVLPIDTLGDRPLGAAAGIRLEESSIGAIEVNGGWTDVDPTAARALARADAWTLAVGAEKTFGDYVRGRFGYRRDGPIDRRDVTLGLGFDADSGSASVGLAVPLGAGNATLAGVVAQIGITLVIPDPHGMDADF